MLIDQKIHNLNIIAELTEDIELRNDKLWRMNNLYWITTKGGKKEVFRMNRAQKHFYDHYLTGPDFWFRHIILKSRQLGFTTFIDLWILDEILFNPNREGMIIADKVQNAKEIFDKKVDFAMNNFSPELKDLLFKVSRNSAKKIQVTFNDIMGDKSVSSIAVDISGRGGTYQYLHVSEFASMCALFPERSNKLEQETIPALPFGAFVFFESTAEGMSGRFYDLFNEAWNNKAKLTRQMSIAKYVPHFYNWQWDDVEMASITDNISITDMEQGEIDWAEYRTEHKLTDTEITYYYLKWLQLGKSVHKLRQEYPTTAEEAFVNSGQAYFSTTKTVSMLNAAVDGICGEVIVNRETSKYEFQEVSNGNLEMFHKPQPGVRYIIGGDTAEGLAHGDAQVLVIINELTEDVDAVYRSQIPPDEFADVSYDIGQYYNYALMAIESNKDGLWVNTHLEKRGYQNLYYRTMLDDITKTVTKYFGWRTTSATRPFMLASLKAVFNRKWSGFPKALLQEMLKFVRNQKGRPEAMAGEHDDVLMASAVGYSVLQEKGKQVIDQKKVERGLMSIIFNEEIIA